MQLLRSIVRAGLRGRCPACGEGEMFRGLYAMHDRCPCCGIQFEESDGAWLGALPIGYGFGALFGLLLTFIELAWEPIRSSGLHPGWTIAALTLPATVLAYRPAKGIWFGILYRYGLMSNPGV